MQLIVMLFLAPHGKSTLRSPEARRIAANHERRAVAYSLFILWS
jgi:hypothetical protein